MPPWEHKLPAFCYTWFLLLSGSSYASAVCSQTLVPEHPQRLGHRVSPGIQKEERQRGEERSGRGEGQSLGNFCSEKSLQGEKTQLVFQMSFLNSINRGHTQLWKTSLAISQLHPDAESNRWLPIFPPLPFRKTETRKYSRIHSNARPGPHLHPCRNHLTAVIADTSEQGLHRFPLVDGVLLCKWPALQSLQDPKCKGVPSPAPIGLEMGGMPRCVWVVLPNDTHPSPPPKKIKPSHDFSNTPNAASKGRATKQNKKVFLDANRQLLRAKGVYL